MDARLTDELTFFFGLSVITLLVIGVVVYFGLKLNRAVEKRSEKVRSPLHITLTGTVLWACVVGFWVICAVARELMPESLLGGFLNKTDGVATVIVGSVVFAAVAGAVLEKLGYPIAKRSDNA